MGASFSTTSAWLPTLPTVPSNRSATPPESGRSSWIRIVVATGGRSSGVSTGRLGAIALTSAPPAPGACCASAWARASS